MGLSTLRTGNPNLLLYITPLFTWLIFFQQQTASCLQEFLLVYIPLNTICAYIISFNSFDLSFNSASFSFPDLF